MAFLAGSAIGEGNSSTTSRSFTRPAGALDGHILFVTIYTEVTGLTISLSPGAWVKETAACGIQSASSPTFEMHTFWNRQGGETGSITATWDGSAVWNTVMAGAFTERREGGTPVDGFGGFNPTASSTTVVTVPRYWIGWPNGITIQSEDHIAYSCNTGGFTYAWTAASERADFGGCSYATRVLGSATKGLTPTQIVSVFTTCFWAAGSITLAGRLDIAQQKHRAFPFAPGSPWAQQ